MPTPDTFDCEPIMGFVQKYLMRSTVSVDPYARNKRWATWTNDLNPDTTAQYHLDAEKFLGVIYGMGTRPDLVIIDPPYSPRQVKECYDSIGMKMAQEDALLGLTRKRLKTAINLITNPGAIALTFGWNTVGMGKGWEQIEILLVCHGSDHNDTICLAERKLSDRQQTFSLNDPTPKREIVGVCAA